MAPNSTSEESKESRASTSGNLGAPEAAAKLVMQCVMQSELARSGGDAPMTFIVLNLDSIY